MNFLKQYYQTNYKQFKESNYGCILASFSNEKDLIWIVKPFKEEHYTNIKNLNTQAKRDFDYWHQEDINHSQADAWRNKVYYLISSRSSLYRDIFLKLIPIESKDMVKTARKIKK